MWRWLESTEKLQSQTYGYPIAQFQGLFLPLGEVIYPHPNMEDLAKYMDWNQTAAVQELAELREEFSWKPWATDAPFVNRERLISESVDAMHFIANMLVAVGCDDEEIWVEYQRKQDINRQRAASGTYSARKGGLAEGSDVT
jgi:hypothetical protein